MNRPVTFSAHRPCVDAMLTQGEWLVEMYARHASGEIVTLEEQKRFVGILVNGSVLDCFEDQVTAGAILDLGILFAREMLAAIKDRAVRQEHVSREEMATFIVLAGDPKVAQDDDAMLAQLVECFRKELKVA